MRARVRRYLGSLLAAPTAAAPSADGLVSLAKVGAKQPDAPLELTRRQSALLLLHIAGAIEHGLMVEYLYAAFSLGGSHVPVERQAEVSQWQESIFGIAKEEMGHLMTVQNLLRCLGGPLNLDREDYPWDSEFYPFPFQLEPLTRASLAKYVYAESPKDWTGTEAEEVRELAERETHSASLHHVGELYSQLRILLADPRYVKSADFRESTHPFQANWDEWGRGYQGGARGNTTGGSMPGTPNVILMPVTSRSTALDALDAIAMQGEANPTADDSAPSHFARFLRIFRQFPRDDSWSPSRNVPVNPIVTTSLASDAGDDAWEGTRITHPEGELWGHLFNVRYRLLLTNLLHTFEYPSNLSEASQTSPRGLLVHATFGEMYNLRALAQILVQTPLTTNKEDGMAGPPFQMPYTLRLPVDAVDRWRLHLDLFEASGSLADRLLEIRPDGHPTYLRALQEVDARTTAMIESVLIAHGRRSTALLNR